MLGGWPSHLPEILDMMMTYMISNVCDLTPKRQEVDLDMFCLCSKQCLKVHDVIYWAYNINSSLDAAREMKVKE